MQPKPVLLLSMADDRGGRQLASALGGHGMEVVNVQVPEVAAAALATVQAQAYIIDEALGVQYCEQQIAHAHAVQSDLALIVIQRTVSAAQELRYLQSGVRYVLQDDTYLVDRLSVLLKQLAPQNPEHGIAAQLLSQDILEAIPHAAVIIDTQRCVLAANNLAQQWSAQVQQDFMRPLHPRSTQGDDDLIKWRRHIDAALAKINGEQSVFEQTLVFHGHRLRYTWMAMASGSCLITAQSLGSVQAHSEEAIQNHMQAHKLESLCTFAAGMAHEFNNTFGIISASLGLMKHKQQDFNHIYEPIDQAVARGHRLTDSILAFAQQQETSFDNIDLVQVLQNSFNVIKNTVHDDIHIGLRCEC